MSGLRVYQALASSDLGLTPADCASRISVVAEHGWRLEEFVGPLSKEINRGRFVKFITPLRFGLLGIGSYVGAVAWVATSKYLAQRDAPSGWIVDHATPIGALYLAAFGALLVVSALVWAVAAWIGRRTSK